MTRGTAHPWMANSTPETKTAMLEAIGAPSIEALFHQIPADHRLSRPLNLPPTLSAEVALKRHLVDLLKKNASAEDNLSFLGAGTYQHHVPAVCEEVARRAEWLMSVFGSPMSDHGRNQAWFEFCSLLGELIKTDCVGLPVYSWGAAIGHAIRMASRINGRREALVVKAMSPERLGVVKTNCEPPQMASHIAVTEVGYDPATGRLDMDDYRAKLSDAVAAVYFEVPSFLGVIETEGAEIARLAHEAGAEVIVGVDPSSLGILKAPPDYGADIVVGTLQPLGVPMNAGGGVGGFIATRDEERYAREYPTLMISITETIAGEYGFGLSLFHQTSYGMRDEGKDWTGNSVYMWAVVAAAYMGLLGPDGFRDLGHAIITRAHAAARRLDAIEGVRVVFPSGFFKEFVVNFDATGKTVAEINGALRARGIFGGKDLSAAFPELGESALYAVTEIHTEGDIARLAAVLEEVIR
ncbi:aminomethyl-transferring glycine dehydrogenase subunit GcvPA [Acuticoccus sp. M5D2P5]|uniref:aminomethyl-transferring glycine dehydrogenase subunit GcvPA n=1 Tax=Acuticoccus kalidii TaxID=2910977 RepID=UPI001F3F3E3E|nr:aminomethyl-transferring glycine dehydrogenase subunit GcvPA [Acuticoccus kalidii]MCF3932514.1 aminomethyl-transferring glycine dehydrogenase subunit GcvPA [Acuticoccus kalidii]